MFTGHFAVALAGAGRGRALPLSLLVAASFCGDLTEAFVAALDVADPTRVWSHSLPATAAAGLVLGLAWRAVGGTWSEGAIVLLVAVSHTALDFLTGNKTIWPGVPPAGLNLYQRPIPEYLLELTAIGVGWWTWRSAIPEAKRASAPVWLMVAILVALQTIVFAGMLYFGPDLTTDNMSKFVR
jgi:hypothetical protein